jgi:hypothetical protein
VCSERRRLLWQLGGLTSLLEDISKSISSGSECNEEGEDSVSDLEHLQASKYN